ncbi:hypothetical protein EDD85DRAFT_1008477 [Armillaria nabsnona]|nr:hypothetical protein EDD85DRAFT_1008477 [Armillaria nabsnona]
MVWTNASKLGIVANNYLFSSTIQILKSETSFIRSPVSKIKFDPGQQHSEHGDVIRIVLLHLDDNGTLDEICSIDTDLHAVNITGDIIALNHDVSQTVIYNWKTDESSHLNDVGDSQHDHYLQVVFAPPTLVVRAGSIALYTSTSTFTRISIHSFDWIDGASAERDIDLHPHPLPDRQSLGIDASELYLLELYLLSSFPPTLVSKILSRCGALRCTNVILGSHLLELLVAVRAVGIKRLRTRYLPYPCSFRSPPCSNYNTTAVWIRPHDRAMVSHWEERNGREMLIAAIFHSPLDPTDQVRARKICMNTFNNGQPSIVMKTEGIENPRTIRKGPNAQASRYLLGFALGRMAA